MSRETDGLHNLSGRVAVVTGGGSGLGREFCDVLAQFGADVVCASLHQERAEETCRSIERYGHRTWAAGVDVSDHDQVKAVFARIEKVWGGVDILVNNAGVTTARPVLHEMDIRDWHKVINVDLHGVFYCMKEALRLMMNKKRGSIINITSLAGLGYYRGYDGSTELISNVAYVTAKTALVGLTKRAAAEYGRYGIRVNGIAPGWFPWTRLPESRGIKSSEEEREKAKAGVPAPGIPLRRSGKPEDLRNLLLFLASDASGYLTGQIIADDGGASSY